MFEVKPPLDARRFRGYVCTGHVVVGEGKEKTGEAEEKKESVVRTEDVGVGV